MSMNPSWEILMVQAQQGNSQSYNVLLTEVSRYLKSFLRFKVSNTEAGNDVLQDILMSLHKARHTYDSNFPFKPWLFKIVQSRLVDHFRKVGNREELGFAASESFLGALAAEAEISMIEVEQFRRAVASLSEDQRSIVVALKVDGKTVREVSRELAMSESAVKVAAHRAYVRLYELMEVEA